MISENRHIVGIYAGIAGCGSGDNAVKLSEMLEKEYPNINIKITSDIENVTGSVGDVSDCIAVICGTGNIVCAKKNNLYHRLGGWGYLFDDAGSGYTIGRDAICAALAEKEGIGEKTILTNLVERKINGEILGKINEIYSKGVGYIASFSEYVFEAYSKKDRVAERILNKNFSHIANLINHAYKEYNCNATVVFSGGIAKNKEIVEIFLQDKIDAKIKVIFPDMPQVYGACRNCCSSFSTLGKSFKENFKNDYNKIIKRKGR